MINFCPCCSNLWYVSCCAPYHQNIIYPATAEALMRSRYSAFALHLIDYLVATTHPYQRYLHDKAAIKNWAEANKWLRLEIIKVKETIVEFKAYYMNGLKQYCHHEISTFKKEDGIWYYFSGK